MMPCWEAKKVQISLNRIVMVVLIVLIVFIVLINLGSIVLWWYQNVIENVSYINYFNFFSDKYMHHRNMADGTIEDCAEQYIQNETMESQTKGSHAALTAILISDDKYKISSIINTIICILCVE